MTFHLLTSYEQDRRRPCYIFRVLLHRISRQFQIGFSQMFSFHDTASVPCYSTQFFICTRSTIRVIHFFYILRQIQHMVQHNTVLTRSSICVHRLFIVDHCIRLRKTMTIVKDRSHINQTQTISPVYIFLINSTDQELHRPSRFRVYVFLLDISSKTIYSYIYYVKLYPRFSLQHW